MYPASALQVLSRSTWQVALQRTCYVWQMGGNILYRILKSGQRQRLGTYNPDGNRQRAVYHYRWPDHHPHNARHPAWQ